MSNLMAARCPQQFRSDFADAVLEGLSKSQKAIPCAYLYDDTGSELFEAITRTEEYYPTRTEIALLKRYAPEVAQIIGRNATLVEFGSGSSRKTKILINALENLKAYIPIDISDGALLEAEARLKVNFPNLRVVPLHADFNQPMELPHSATAGARLGFFPGSTIGNFSRDDAKAFLARSAKLLGSGNFLVIGVDLKKDRQRLEAAYNDVAGVTAAFSLNLLDRMNKELDADFEIEKFAHRAIYNDDKGRIEIYLESLQAQSVNMFGVRFEFEAGERIHTENSHKYSPTGFSALADAAGWDSERVWIDDEDLFSVHCLRAR